MSQSGIWKTMWSFQIWINHHEKKVHGMLLKGYSRVQKAVAVEPIVANE